ncbi:MAG: ABC transporter ATP-binding protein [Deltaproteobacteria bacterium]|nr:ABC transporter ATP-binding protein [Deltaproteobacteria bacterium]
MPSLVKESVLRAVFQNHFFGHIMIDIQSLTKNFGSSRVLHDLNLHVPKCSVFGFLGPNGAGKSTAIKVLMGFIQACSGRILVDGMDHRNVACRRSLGYLPENPSVYENLTALECLAFCGRASGIDRLGLSSRAIQILERVNLAQAAKNQVRTYSKGMKQRLGFAMALVHDPKLLVLDEPMSGLDPMGRRLITDLILECRDQGRTVFFSSHILSDVERLCDRIGIINHGRLLFEGRVEDFRLQGSLEDSFVALIEADSRTRMGGEVSA